MINIKEFDKLDLRVGTILKADLLKDAKKPSYLLEIDFGKIGIKSSSAQITELYKPNELVGRQIIAVVNFPPKRIAGIKSEVLVLGANNNNENVVLLEPQKNISNGAKVG
jgi:tRNA-binding protein